jgi:hypothetical protein
MRKLIAVVVAAAAVTIGGAVPADAYMFTRNGYTFADTSYYGNVPGSYFRTVSRYDRDRGYLFVGLSGYDQVCDSYHAAVRIRGYDVQTRTWKYDNILWVSDACRGEGQGLVTVPVARLGIDAVVVADGIRGRTFGTKWVRIWYR